MSLVDDTFGPEGLLASRFPGYEPREQQVVLAKEIERVIADGENLLAEAPTGVGKSVAYLVPAIEHAVTSGTTVLVVTANIVLQEQLVDVDLPRLKEILPVAFDFALAKGRGNYLCLERFGETQTERAIAGLRIDDEANFGAVRRWAAETTRGDLSELPFEPSVGLRRLFTVGSDDCLGFDCPRKLDCFANKARSKLASARVVVANYALFFSDLQVRSATDGEVGILPRFDVLVLDEAHRAAEIARDFFGFRHTVGSVRWAIRLLGGAPAKAAAEEIPELDTELKERTGRAAAEFFADLARRAGTSATRLSSDVQAEVLIGLLGDAAGVLERSAATLPGLERAARRRLNRGAERCALIASNLTRATRRQSEAEVFFVEKTGEDRVALCSKPIEVGELLRERVFESSEIRSVIAASATLTTGRSSNLLSGERAPNFEFMADELGAEAARTIAVDSPFDFAERCLFVVPGASAICLPGESQYGDEAAAVVAGVANDIAALGKGTLGLFTTRRGMQRAYEVALDRVVFDEDDPLARQPRIMCQGSAPRSELVRRMKAYPGSVLLGTSSFWEGIDVSGDALACVVMDKLPFPTPDDPVIAALDARDRNAFVRHMLPRALFAFRQGFGRLIRTKTDRGVVICLDRRIFEKGYGRKFLMALPRGVRVSRDLSDVARFLGDIGGFK